MKSLLIAPCGMNCNICYAYIREKDHCPGCRIDDPDKAVSCQRCIIANCENIKSKRYRYCYQCGSYPCKRLRNLDNRYRTKYRMSMLENLSFIQEHGIRKFTRKEIPRWTCSKCGQLLSCHRNYCLSCKTPI